MGAGFFAEVLPGQIPTDVAVMGVLAVGATAIVLYSLGKIFGRKSSAPQASPLSPLSPPASSPVPAHVPADAATGAPPDVSAMRGALSGPIKVKIKGPADITPPPARPAAAGEAGKLDGATRLDAPDKSARDLVAPGATPTLPSAAPAAAAATPADREAERERLRAQFARSAEQAVADRRSGGAGSSGERAKVPLPPPSSSASPATGVSRSNVSGRVPDVTPMPQRVDRGTARTERFPRETPRSGTDKIDLRMDLRLDRGAQTERIDSRYERDRRGPTPAVSGPINAADEPFYDKWKEKRIADELQEQNTELTNLLSMLPGLIKRLTETTKKRELAPLLADTVMRLCMPPPERVMVFFLAKSKEDLILAARLGYDEPVDTHAVMKMPRHYGRIGYALRHQLTMDEKDFERDGIDDDPPPNQTWHVEVASPLIFNKEVLGAISVEGFSGYNKNAKRLVGIAANLGSLAISLAEKTAMIQHQANSDALTGLYNKRYFFEKLEQEVEKARDTGRPLSIFMFDLDHFKKYNDRNGHQAGDEALKITGGLLNERKRETDTAARYGGEEFIVILPDTPKEGGYIFAESYRKIVESYPYPHGEGQPLGRVSISGGVSTFPEDGQSPTSLIEAADECLYRSKEHGRNHVTKRMPKDQLAGPTTK